MSVLIKGFPMPNNCGACPLRLAWCRERIYMVTRPERCPLVPVPPHGRLIDTDALLKSISRSIDDDSELADVYEEDYEMVNDWLASAPTIIPAEEGDNEP